MTVKPFTPKQAGAKKIAIVPDFVIEAVNELLVLEISGGKYATLMQKKVETLILDKAMVEFPSDNEDKAQVRQKLRDRMFKENWLDFEPIFRKHGWKVDYDRPAYNENYEAFWKFTAN